MSALLAGLLDDFPRLSVLVIGDAMLDCYVEGTSRGISSEAPVPIVALGRRVCVPGGAANAAANARSLGARVDFLAVVGTDGEGEHLRRCLQHVDVGGTHVLSSPRRKTLTKERVIADGQMLLRLDHGSTEPMDPITEQALLKQLGRAHQHVDAVVVSDYGYGVLTPRVIARLGELQARAPKVLLVDARNLPAYRSAGVTAIKPNFAEAARLVGLIAANGTRGAHADRARTVMDHGARLLDLTGARLAAVTLDTDGAVVIERGGIGYRTYARPIRQARAAGAGDTFGVAFALALTAKADIPAAADLASAAAAIVVAKDGTAACGAAELRSSLVSDPKPILERAELVARVEAFRRRQRRIVFTNGCFDLLHRGHVAYLSDAKAQGDVLIVGINTDEGVRRLKGPSRPITSLPDRMEMLAAMSSVDLVVPFDEDTPEGLIRLIRPDVFVKGGDYRRDQLPEAPLVEALGGAVRILPYVEQRSTSQIISRIRQWTGEGAMT
jgi:D-beta-D-heptose 7-phosphate kinase / D-beta-D-heptose 1-phosphate adenosyltransferase